MSCGVGQATEGLQNEFDVGEVTKGWIMSSATSQLILQLFFCFSYVTGSGTICSKGKGIQVPVEDRILLFQLI